MHRCNDNIGCLSVEVFKIGRDVESSCFKVGDSVEAKAFLLSPRASIESFRIGYEAKADAYRIGGKLLVNCFQVCSINKDKPYWMWDAGEILYWDNKEYIAV